MPTKARTNGTQAVIRKDIRIDSKRLAPGIKIN